MITYTPNFEDILLWRCFRDVEGGFYVDVGAHHGTHASVTRWFYDQGWSGINIEPGEGIENLRMERPRDVNLELAVADFEGQATFRVHSGNTGTSTLEATSPEIVTERAGEILERTVQVSTLTKILDDHALSRTIHFLKIDAEGAEDAIVRTADFERYRPLIVLIESTEPYTNIRKACEWQDILAAARYRFAYFDGINDFWVREESSDLLEKFLLPVNVLDNFQVHNYEVAGLRSYVQAHAEELSRAQALIAATGPQKLVPSAAIRLSRKLLRAGARIVRGRQ